jgi:hypothetical protein
MTVTRQVWGFIERRDHRVMRRINRWRAPRWIRYWMLAATRMGDGWLWYSLAFVLLAFGGAQRFAAVGAAGTAALVGVAVFKILKRLSHRPRPCQIEPHCWSKVLPPRQILLSVRPHHDSVFHCTGAELFLPWRGASPVLYGRQHRHLASRAGHALHERCPRRRHPRCWSRLRFTNRFRGHGFPLMHLE